MTVAKLQLIRRLVFASIGLCCTFYAFVYFVWGMSNGLNPFLPGIVGAIGTIVLVLASFMGGQPISSVVYDELSRAEWRRALIFGYWLAVAMYPLFGVLLWREIVDFKQSFAVMGTLTGGLPLLYYCWLDMRG